uniref:Uncharacterized protein n=1 Tax=Panagrolaimus sp. JU765 TaxID=591449 RepID=A0AC34Q2L9_9BILA
MAKEKEKLVQLENENQQLLEMFESICEEKEQISREQQKFEKDYKMLAEEKQETEKKIHFYKSEVKRNEDLLELMEKKFDEQHTKIMRLHALQKENESNLETLESQRMSLIAQLETLRQKYADEKTWRINLEEEVENLKSRAEQSEKRAEQAVLDLELTKSNLEAAESNAKLWQDRSQRQAENVSELQKSVSELNEKVNNFDAILNKERSAKRKYETEIEVLEEKVAHLQEIIDKSEIKKETMKEQIRLKDNQIKKLEKKLEEKTDIMDNCIAELKKMHKTAITELQQQNDDLKRKCKKMESEIQQYKLKVDDRESSVESDSRPCSRMNYSIHSSLGNRQYSTNSLCSSVLSLSMTSSTRTLGGCRSTTDYGSGTGTRSPYDLHRESSMILKSPSYSRMTRSITQMDDYSSSLARSPSISQFQANERKIQELEKKIQTANTDYQLLKREIEVYKTQLQENEHEKDLLSKQLRTANENLNDLSRKFDNEERKNETLQQTIVKLNRDIELWKVKHEEAINDSKHEILAERKKHQEKADAIVQEYELKIQHVLAKSQAENRLHTDLIEAQSQLDRALAQIQQLEKVSKSQFNIGEVWEKNYQAIVTELEELRDENASLKTKIRRQYKQIELLTQQSDLDIIVNELENKVDVFQGRLDASTHESLIG